LYDFASTICYVAHRVMERMAGDLDDLALELDWRPIDLTIITGWRRGAGVDGPRRDNAIGVASGLGVEVRMPTTWLDSRRANAVALALAGTTSEPAWRERVYSAVYSEGRSLDDPELLPSLARDLGLDLPRLSGQAQLDALDQITLDAHAAEVTGVPTFLLDQYPFGGIQEEATMRSLLGRWAEKKRRQTDARRTSVAGPTSQQ
jgi:predicted DsbA family dithiol-disulfide isomerase